MVSRKASMRMKRSLTTKVTMGQAAVHADGSRMHAGRHRLSVARCIMSSNKLLLIPGG